ncbi:hypothetical protein E2C01_078395 [Portunus trituberculatus]|uniref:Uncharacterized protein n=1 Tax=Portunus trituberculatus TaxID=210409 RepID=A0A5B7IGV6_PORTR|nr:hypothetical protein [Portunus trituberculatus]
MTHYPSRRLVEHAVGEEEIAGPDTQMRGIYTREHDIMYNTTKTDCIVVPPKNSKVQYVQAALLNNEPLQFVDSFT